jgi:hypothetical protein
MFTLFEEPDLDTEVHWWIKLILPYDKYVRQNIKTVHYNIVKYVIYQIIRHVNAECVGRLLHKKGLSKWK